MYPLPPKLSISSNRQINGNARFRFLHKALFSCVVPTCTLTWREQRCVFTHVHRQMPLNPAFEREGWGSDWCAVLTLIWRPLLLQPGVGLVSCVPPAYCSSAMWLQLEKAWKVEAPSAGSRRGSAVCLPRHRPANTATQTCDCGLILSILLMHLQQC